ncbi:hypothetical protein GQR58_024252 [Nymphon striatum]|nr:hypothetical protein GQR58_024252 [Nymphon striatum]
MLAIITPSLILDLEFLIQIIQNSTSTVTSNVHMLQGICVINKRCERSKMKSEVSRSRQYTVKSVRSRRRCIPGMVGARTARKVEKKWRRMIWRKMAVTYAIFNFFAREHVQVNTKTSMYKTGTTDEKMFSGHLIIIVSITGTVRNLFLLFMETSSPMFIPILMRHRQKSSPPMAIRTWNIRFRFQAGSMNACLIVGPQKMFAQGV